MARRSVGAIQAKYTDRDRQSFDICDKQKIIRHKFSQYNYTWQGISMSLKIYSDGGSRGNPGPSAYAIVVVNNDSIIHEHSEYLGINTNNYAEYRGLISAISYALELKATDVEFVMDSELVIKQMRGEYKVKSENIVKLYQNAKELASSIQNVKYTHVKRENAMISYADSLLNIEMNKHMN